MKYLTEYRDPRLARKLSAEIRRITTRPHVIMEVCGGQTHAIVKFGIDALLPEEDIKKLERRLNSEGKKLARIGKITRDGKK